MRIANGFTLIELMVVITIIVVLLSLLAPALDTAIYQAELATCGARLRAVATSTIAYASDGKRHYPLRVGASDPDFYWQANELYAGNTALNALVPADGANYRPTNYDERTRLNGYMAIDQVLNDPLVKNVSFTGSKADTQVYGAYHLWFGWRYLKPGPGTPMNRLGDRFSFLDNSYRLLASDRNVMQNAGTYVQSAHPDKEGAMHDASLQDGPWDIGAGPEASFQLTIPTWLRNGSNRRGTTDYNFAYDDASVGRVDDVTWDGRGMDPIAEWNNRNNWTTNKVFVPKR